MGGLVRFFFEHWERVGMAMSKADHERFILRGLRAGIKSRRILYGV